MKFLLACLLVVALTAPTGTEAGKGKKAKVMPCVARAALCGCGVAY